MTGAELIAAERQRQIAVEGWTSEHDDGHKQGEIARAGACYAALAGLQIGHLNRFGISSQDQIAAREFSEKGWPWDSVWWRAGDGPLRNLVKAGALIAAEIDRLQRQTDRLEGKDG